MIKAGALLVIYTLTPTGYSWQRYPYPTELECRAALEYYWHENARQVALTRRNGIAAQCVPQKTSGRR